MRFSNRRFVAALRGSVIAILLLGSAIGSASADALDDLLDEIRRATPRVSPYTLEISRVDGELVVSEVGDWMIEGRHLTRAEARFKLADLDGEKVYFERHPGTLYVNGSPTNFSMLLPCRESKACARGGYVDPVTSAYYKPWTRNSMHIDIRVGVEPSAVTDYVGNLRKAADLLRRK